MYHNAGFHYYDGGYYIQYFQVDVGDIIDLEFSYIPNEYFDIAGFVESVSDIVDQSNYTLILGGSKDLPKHTSYIVEKSGFLVIQNNFVIVRTQKTMKDIVPKKFSSIDEKFKSVDEDFGDISLKVGKLDERTSEKGKMLSTNDIASSLNSAYINTKGGITSSGDANYYNIYSIPMNIYDSVVIEYVYVPNN